MDLMRPASLRQLLHGTFFAFTPIERHRAVATYGSILFLDALGFFIFFAVVVPTHYRGLGSG